MRFFWGMVVGGVMGLVGGAGLMLVLFPFFFPPAAVNETVGAAQGRLTVVDEASLREGVKGQDAGHWGKGDLKVYRDQDGGYVVELQDNFEVGPGPNFWMYVNKQEGIDDEDDFSSDSGRTKVAKLKSFEGSQVYEISMADMEGGKALTIWCETFGQYIASADIDLGPA